MADDQPLVSIICICYNHEDFVIQALDSVKKLNYLNTEIIIVDDCSTDQSAHKIRKWIEKHPKTVCIQNQENIGINKSFNKAFQQSSGDYLIDFATDDILLPNAIKILLDGFAKSNLKQLGVVYANADLIDENDKQTGVLFPKNHPIKKPYRGYIYPKILGSSKGLSTSTALYKREVYTALNGYDETLSFEDLDFWIRASKRFSFDFIGKPVLQKRILSNSLGASLFIKSAYTVSINYSILKIVQKAYKLNEYREDYFALINRIKRHIRWSIKTIRPMMILQYLWIVFKCYFQLWFKRPQKTPTTYF